MLHLVHIAAKKGAANLGPSEEVLVDYFYYFKRAANRQEDLKTYQNFFNGDNKKCLKHVSTRCLSIERYRHLY